MKRRSNLDEITSEVYDMAIIGGGITGAGILSEAERQGYRCILIEKNDFSSGTSSKSAKLIHGGLRYLQYGQIGLVKESLEERHYLLEHFPHIVKPLPFMFPIYSFKLKYRIGMIIYQLFSRDKGLPRYTFLNCKETIKQFPAIDQKGLKGSFIYYDAITNDARLCNEVIHNACTSTSILRCVALNYCELKSIDEHDSHIQLNCYDHIEEKSITIKSKYIINASGAWTDKVLKCLTSGTSDYTAPSKGAHIILSQERFPLPCGVSYGSKDEQTAIIFSSYANDNRMFYALPWEYNSVIIGPTDTEYEGDPDNVNANADDISYLLNAVQHFAPSLNITEDDIISTFVGLRPLIRDEKLSKDRSRDFKIWWTDNRILNILGGKLTNFRAMAKSLMKELSPPGGPLLPPSNSPQKGGELQRSKTPAMGKGHSERSEEPPASGTYGGGADIKSKYGEQSSKIYDIFSENPLYKEYLHDDFKIHLAEMVYFIRHQSCYHLDDLLDRRLSLQYVLPAHRDSEIIINKAAELMKKECQWTDEECRAEINSFTGMIKPYFAQNTHHI